MSELGCLVLFVCALAVLVPGVAGERIFRAVVLLLLLVAVDQLMRPPRSRPPSSDGEA